MRTHTDAGAIADKLRDWQLGRGALKERLRNALVRLILNGELHHGDRMPPERRLAAALAVSRTTVVGAYDLLRDEGFLKTRRASGSVVHFTDAGSRVRQHRAKTIGRTYALEPDSESDRLIDFALADVMLLPEFEHYVRDFSPFLRRDSYAACGLMELREVIAQYYTKRGVATSSDEILVTSGAQQAISLAINLCIQRGDAVAVQNPTFFVALDALRMAGARLHALPAITSAQQLRETFVHRSIRAAYVIATNHNPTGYTMSTREREVLAGIADELGVTLIDDIVIDDLMYDRQPPKPLGAFCRSNAVLSVGSLSKVFWSGLRIGWVRAPRSAMAQLTRLKTVADLGNNIISQSIAMNVFADFDAIRSFRCRDLREKRDYTAELLGKHLPAWTFSIPEGGFCLWIAVPTADVRPFTHLARRFGVNIIAGNSMALDDSPVNNLRLVFGGPMEATAEGVRRLAQAWDAFLTRRFAAAMVESSLVV